MVDQEVNVHRIYRRMQMTGVFLPSENIRHVRNNTRQAKAAVL